MGNDFILILNFGGSHAQAMARKLRGQNYYCEVQPGSIELEVIRRKAPRGLLLAGGSVDMELNKEILQMGLPVLALGATAHRMVELLGASCEGTQLTKRASQIEFLPCPLFEGLGESDRYFERIDEFRLPGEFVPIATTVDGLIPAFADLAQGLYGLQFYPESNDPDGARILLNFAEKVCECSPYWSPEFYIDHEVAYLRERIGEHKAVMAISGGVDSTVCAMLMQRAIGNQLRCVFVDTGLLRKGEAQFVVSAFQDQLGMEVTVVDGRARMLGALRGITDAQQKHLVIHDVFIEILQEEARKVDDAHFLVEGTIYPDLLGNAPRTDDVSQIDFLKRIEPIRMLFKDEVRFVGESLGVPKEMLNRQPFPSSGLATRCIGEVTEEKLELIRKANDIFCAEIKEANLDRKLAQYFVVLTDTKTACTRDGEQVYEYACALRAVSSVENSNAPIAKLPYDLIERVVHRIITQLPSVSRVLYDITGKPDALVEWE